MINSIFSGISEQEKNTIYSCFGAVKKTFEKGTTIARMSEKINRIGIIESGKAHIFCIDFDGRKCVMEHLEKGGVFGEIFSLPMEQFAYYIEADSQCTVSYIEYSRIIHPCSNACTHHCNLLNNLFHMAAEKSRGLSLHINILSQRTTRQKLLTYFETQCIKTGTRDFVMPISFTALADYISSDRSAMMRELGKMKDEGLVSTKGRQIHLFA